jgi:hypothetical protein
VTLNAISTDYFGDLYLKFDCPQGFKSVKVKPEKKRAEREGEGEGEE